MPMFFLFRAGGPKTPILAGGQVCNNRVVLFKGTAHLDPLLSADFGA